MISRVAAVSLIGYSKGVYHLEACYAINML